VLDPFQVVDPDTGTVYPLALTSPASHFEALARFGRWARSGKAGK
jgi:hypothetical protein